MAPRAKPKAKATRKPDDKAQFERFVETARTLGVEEVGPEFDRAFGRIVPAKLPSSRKGNR
jgi:hypothetical protein